MIVILFLVAFSFAGAKAADPINVALKKPAAMSSLYSDGVIDDTADKGVDGNTNQDYHAQGHTCFHTEKEATNFWRVDLQDIYKLTSVKVYNRMDCCSDRAIKIALMVGESVENMTQVAYSADQIDDIQIYELPENTAARYVELRQTDADTWLHFCEVEVFASAVFTPCPDQFERNGDSCYYFSSDTQTWSDAVAACEALDNSFISEIEGSDEDNYIISKININDDYWFGGNDLGTEGEWKWYTSETDIVYSNWSATNPSDSEGNEDCMEIHVHKWNDDRCTKTNRYVCEKLGWSDITG